MNTFVKILFPLGAVAAVSVAFITQDWWKLPVALIFILATFQAFKIPEENHSDIDK